MSETHIDRQYLSAVLAKLLTIDSPTGMTEGAVAYVCDELRDMGVAFELTRRRGDPRNAARQTTKPEPGRCRAS